MELNGEGREGGGGNREVQEDLLFRLPGNGGKCLDGMIASFLFLLHFNVCAISPSITPLRLRRERWGRIGILLFNPLVKSGATRLFRLQ